jgi:LysM repeat protein
MRFILIIFVVLFSYFVANAQVKPKNNNKEIKKTEQTKDSKKVAGFSPDSLFVVLKGEGTYIRHKVKKSETVYSITRFYNTEIETLKRYNNDLEKEGLKENQWIIIPINPKVLILNKGKDFKQENHLKVYYTVLPKETMFAIAKGHFDLSVEELQKRNSLKTTDLSVGQQLHIGWLSKAGIPDSLNRLPWLSSALGEENKRLKKKYDAALLEGAKEIKQEGKAVWPKDKQMGTGKNLYILHSQAKQGSVVRIENPMTERVIYAKVIGKVPDTEFAEGSVAMLSSTVAKVLGVLDSAVFLKIQYLQTP